MLVNITVNNWAKYNPRTDVKSCSWFRMDNDFFAHPEFYGATPCTRLIWIFLMCQASKKMNPTIKINLDMACDQTKYKMEEVQYALDALVHIGCIESDHVPVTSNRSNPIGGGRLPSATNERTDERTNEHTLVPSGAPAADAASAGAGADLTKQAHLAIQLLNHVTGRQFKGAKSDLEKAKARLREGFTLADMKLVFEHKTRDWQFDPKMNKFLRPETLLGSKFDGYLQEAKADPEQALKDGMDSLLPEDMRPEPVR